MERSIRGVLVVRSAAGRPWAPGGTLLAYSRSRVGETPGIWEMVVVDPEEPSTERVVHSSPEVQMFPFAWTPDGTEILASTNADDNDIYRIPVDGSDPVPFLATGFDELAPALSPDGKWVAYETDRDGRDEVYVRSFPDGAREVRVSDAGGIGARWSADGTRLIYRVGDSTRVATVRSSAEGIEVLGHEDWFVNDQPGRYISHELHPDGDRVLVVHRPSRAVAPPDLRLTLAVNWLSEVRARLDASGG